MMRSLSATMISSNSYFAAMREKDRTASWPSDPDQNIGRPITGSTDRR
jgi:hypothetical protein